MIRRLGRIITGIVLLALPVSAQDRAPAPTSSPQGTAVKVPYGVGELLEYDISFGKVHVGNGSMEVLPMDTVRGHDTWHTIFRVNGGLRFVYTVHDRYEDWSDIRTLSTLRYRADIDEGGYNPKRRYEIYPDRKEYVEVSKDTTPYPSVARPLNDASFIYFLRTIPLRVGMDTSFNDYFIADKNPVHFKVLRKDTIEVGAGKFSAFVVQPAFQSKLFSEGGNAQIWLSDDENRIMLQMKSKLSFGSLNLYLKNYRPSPTTNVPLNRVP